MLTIVMPHLTIEDLLQSEVIPDELIFKSDLFFEIRSVSEAADTVRELIVAIKEGSSNTFILANADLISPDDHELLIELIELAKKQDISVYALGRYINRQFWLPFTTGKKPSVKVMGDTIGMFSAENANKTFIEVYQLNGQEILVNGWPVTWEGKQTEELFHFFVHKIVEDGTQSGWFKRQDVSDAFWQHLEEKDMVNVFHVTKRTISAVIGANFTVVGSETYYLNIGEVFLHCDTHLFLAAIAAAELADLDGDEDTMMEQYRAAITQYRGEYLHGMESAWIEAERTRLRGLYLRALVNVAKDADDPESQLVLFIRAHAQNHLREDIVRQIMQLALDLKKYQIGINAYKALNAQIKKMKQIAKLDPRTTSLYNQLVKKTN